MKVKPTEEAFRALTAAELDEVTGAKRRTDWTVGHIVSVKFNSAEDAK
jgi:hypothetical protein